MILYNNFSSKLFIYKHNFEHKLLSHIMKLIKYFKKLYLLFIANISKKNKILLNIILKEAFNIFAIEMR